MRLPESIHIAVIGLGYVGLPLAVEFGKNITTLGFDLKKNRIEELRSGVDSTMEVDAHELREAALLTFSDNVEHLKECNHYIIAVPTPIDQSKRPDRHH